MGLKEIWKKTIWSKNIEEKKEREKLKKELKEEIISENREKLKEQLKEEIIREEKDKLLGKKKASSGKGMEILNKLAESLKNTDIGSTEKMNKMMGKNRDVTYTKTNKKQEQKGLTDDKIMEMIGRKKR